ncbi:MAG: alpha-2-macroglobulin family protein [Alphaproteobacteria bacterium]|nr:alpha-2-macroglobulin family protein [Alphaproteobacteria bacterium]
MKGRKQKKSSRKWLRYVAYSIVALVVLGVGFLLFGHIGNKTKIALAVSVPAPASFVDSNSASFITSSHMPEVNNNRTLTAPETMTVSYNWISGEYAPAFKINMTTPDIARDVKITPYTRGTWSIRGPNTIAFAPDSNWLPDTKYTISIGKKLLSDDVRPDTRVASFTTPKIAATIDSFNVYPDPSHERTVVGVAIVSFNYPIETTDFADRVSVKLGMRRIKFNVRFDRFNRTAIITTDPISVDQDTHTLRLKINRINSANTSATTKKVSASVIIESVDNFFKISGIKSVAADDAHGNPQQLILLDMTAPANDKTNWAKNIDVFLLPKYADADEDSGSHVWTNDEINQSVLSKSKKITINRTDFANPIGVYQYAFAYDISDEDERYIYVRVHNDIKSNSGFVLKNGVERVLPIAYPEKTVKIAGTGALLSLAGDKKLTIVARGGADTAYVNLYKIKYDEINHLISQTYNIFAPNIEFKSWSFGVYDMASVFQKRISFADTKLNKTNYASVDLGDYLDRGTNDNTGIFVIQTGASESSAEFSDRRLILLTNLGIIRKVAADGTSAVFVSQLDTGAPSGDTEIFVLGRNGNAVWAGRTDANGFVAVPNFAWEEYHNEREPVAIVVRNNDDVSFIPYNSADTHVGYSKFDIDGAYTASTTPMNAFVFSDRGIYRPGETAIIAGIIKNKTFTKLSSVPIKIEIVDSRGRTVREEIFTATADGMFDLSYNIANSAQIGEYTTNVFLLNNKNRIQDTIGTMNFRVQEFTPDNLKINADILGSTENGWISTSSMFAKMSLFNLFGTPATNRRIAAHATLKPIEFVFPEYREYTFTPNFISGAGLSANAVNRAQTFSVELPDVKTDENGSAVLDINFNQEIPNGTYLMTLNVTGFDGSAGTGVQTTLATRVSNAEYLVGYHANSNLNYVLRDDVRNVNLVALDTYGERTSVNGLTIRTIRRENLTSLVKDFNDYYKYQTITQDTVISTSTIDILATGTDIRLDTTHGGTYFVQITDNNDRILANIEYFVANSSNTDMSTNTDSEMKIKLDADEYAAGDTVNISITTPYIGTGLITIERDRVYAYKWFRTNSTTSVQQITLPDGFEGSGYINVSFVRDINSRDVFTTPYTSAVAPFRASTVARNIDIDLSAPETITDNRLPVSYRVSKNSKIMIFAVNTGILQVAKYKLPNPLSHFFPKSALQVETYQILSLLLPEYRVLSELAKTGGGDFAEIDTGIGNTLVNPFARKTNKPVAFYSGIIDARANQTATITFDIPEHFNGSIRVFAVATNDNSVGASNIETHVQSPIMLSTSAPLVVAPDDVFDVNTIVTNMTNGTTATAVADVDATVSSNLEIISGAAQSMTIPYGGEKLWSFVIKAKPELGNGDIKISADIHDGSDVSLSNRTTTSTLSVRPITTYQTKIKSGMLRLSTTTVRNFTTDMYPELAKIKLYISPNNTVIVKPLFEYLGQYEYACTEQIVSKALPYALMPANDILGTTYLESKVKVADAISTLKNRQNDDGSFDWWTGGDTSRNNETSTNTAYITAYVVQFLEIAKKSDFDVPKNMLSRAIDFLRTYAGTRISDEPGAAAHAFAIYVLTQNGYITTGYIDAFEEYANANIKNWQHNLMGAYIATAYKILKQEQKANSLITKYRPALRSKFEFIDTFRNNVANDANYAYLVNRYFRAISSNDIGDNITEYINDGDYSSYTSAAIIMGISGNMSGGKKTTPDDISIIADGTPVELNAFDGTITADIPLGTKQLSIQCQTCTRKEPMYYTTISTGFPTDAHEQSNGIEISREYFDENGNRLDTVSVGDSINVKISVRSRRGDIIPNVVITDLVPGGFIVGDPAGDITFAETREDRILIFLDVTRDGQTITYTAQAGVAGNFHIPPIYAASLYNPQINATNNVGKMFTVKNAFTE